LKHLGFHWRNEVSKPFSMYLVNCSTQTVVVSKINSEHNMEEWAFDVDRMRRGGATHVFSYIMSK